MPWGVISTPGRSVDCCGACNCGNAVAVAGKVKVCSEPVIHRSFWNHGESTHRLSPVLVDLIQPTLHRYKLRFGDFPKVPVKCLKICHFRATKPTHMLLTII